VSIPGEVRVVDHVPSSFAKLVTAVAPRSIALSGGGTARTCYELLATAADVDWRSVEIFFGDERWVPVQDPDSNEGMARLAFLDEVEPAAIHSMREAGPTIEEAADAYDALLRASPPIEVVHLGLGPDGHTCSLFPGSPSLDETERLALATGDNLHPHRRLTITFPAIAKSRIAVVTVAGSDKREAMDRLRAGEDLPAARVRAEQVVWLVDRAAAGLG
jgi:6-phosphogluconolactonase